MFETLIAKIKSLKKGTYHTIVYAHSENGYTKTTTMVARLVNYYHIKEVRESGKTEPSEPRKNTIVIVPHILTYNTKTGNYLLHVYPTKHHQPRSTYTNPSGETCTSEEYYDMSGRKPSGPSPVYQIKLQDLVAID